MAHISFNIFSRSLGMQTNAQIVIPQLNTNGEIGVKNGATNGKFKCLYLLHGLSDDQTVWMRRTSIERYATQHGICVVMPMGGRSFYSDMPGANYYGYIAKELPAIIESTFNVSTDAKDRFICGQSMGGYGAMKIGLKEVGRYGGIIALSSVANIHSLHFTEVLKPVFGKEIPKDADLFELVKEHNADAVKPRIYMTVGTEDYMYKDNVELKNHIDKYDYDFTFSQKPGGHTWDFWDQEIQPALEWMLNK